MSMLNRVLCLLAISISAFVSTAFAAEDYISVKAFGAKGDGIADDAPAIQKAIDEAQKQGRSLKTLPGLGMETSIYFGTSKTVFFPSGIYKISQTLRINSIQQLKGDKAILVPASGPSKLTAISGPAWQTSFEGLQFVGFQQAISINTGGVDVSKIVIADCDFLNNKVAIDLSAQSALTIIRENRFFGNDKVLIINSGDKVDMYDNWITSGRLSGVQDAQIINKGGVLHFDKNLLVPVPPAGSAVEPAWINNYHITYIDGVRQGGEPGSFTLINNFAKAMTTNPVIPNGVSIRNSDCYAIYGNKQGYFQPAALRLINIPNNVVLDNLKGFVDAKVIDFSQQSTKKPASLREAALDPFFVKIDIRNVQGSHYKHNNGTDIPDELKKFIVP